MRIEKSYRGISKRLTIHYLEGLGGRAVDADGDPVEGGGDDPEVAARVDRVEGDGWTAHLSTDEVAVGRSLTLTQVDVVFEGSDDVVPGFVERFGRKAMRAGG